MAKAEIIHAWHNRLHSIISNLDHSSAATLGRILKADVNGLPVESANTDAELADAVAKRHTQGTDTALGVLGTKNPPIDADKVVERDSTAGDALVTSTWAQVKAFLKTYFDTLYAALLHRDRHKWLGSDELNIKDLMIFPFAVYFIQNWLSHPGWTDSIGAGGTLTDAVEDYAINTGPTINTVVSRRCDKDIYFTYTHSLHHLRWSQFFYAGYAMTNSDCWLGVFETPTAPTGTQKHIGWHIKADGKLYATCGNGTTETDVDTGITVSAATFLYLHFKAMADNVKFYNDTTLVATITTNRPYGHLYPLTYVKTLEAVLKYTEHYTLILIKGPE